MGTSRMTRVILGLLIIGLGLSVLFATKIEREKRQLASEYAKTQETLAQLDEERGHLNQELADARQTLDGQAEDLSNLQTELGDLQDRLGKTEDEVGRLQRGHVQLRQENLTLAQELEDVRQEKEMLESKLSSLKELRLAIHGVKQKLRDERWQAWRAHIEAKQQEDRRVDQGNRGFLVRNGISTIGSQSAVHIRVLEPQAQ